MELMTYITFLSFVIVMVVGFAVLTITMIKSLCDGIFYQCVDNLHRVPFDWFQTPRQRIRQSIWYRTYYRKLFEEDRKPKVDYWYFLLIPLSTLVIYSLLYWTWRTYPF